MEVSAQSNNYQMMNAQQQHVIQPVPQEPASSNKDIYEASQGNVIRKDGEVGLTPQGQNNVSNKQDANVAADEAAAQAEKDAQRENATNFLGAKSKQSQVEIYLAVATDSKVELGNDDTASIIESLRDVQKQNNVVEAYATYQENQNGGKAVLF